MSIGPICSSMVFVSWNASARGMSFQPNLGAPMSTVMCAMSVHLNVEHAGLGLELERLAAGLRRRRPIRRSACRCRRLPPPSRRYCRCGCRLRCPACLGSCSTIIWSKCDAGRSATARAAAGVNASLRPRRSTTTISLPRPFILRKGRVAGMASLYGEPPGQHNRGRGHSSRKNEQNSALKRCNHKPWREAAETAAAQELDLCAFSLL